MKHKVGDKVIEYIPCKIIAVQGDGLYTIEFDDGYEVVKHERFLIPNPTAKIKEWIEEEKKTTHSTYGLTEVIVAYGKVLKILERGE